MRFGKIVILSGLGALGLTLIPAGLTSSRWPAVFEARAQDNGPTSQSSGLEDRLKEDQSYGPSVDPNANANQYGAQQGGTPPTSQSTANLKNQLDKAYLDFQSAQNSGDPAAINAAYGRYTGLKAQMEQLQAQSVPQPER